MGVFGLVKAIVNQAAPIASAQTATSALFTCIQNCVSTATQPNYVCGTDGQTYMNERTLQCSNMCSGGTGKFLSDKHFFHFH